MSLHIMSAGPTSVHPEVLKASQRPLRNTDLDPEYIAFQRKTEEKISRLLHTKAKSFIMLGEAMLGLDGAMASLIEPGDRVLILSNGVFGAGFEDIAKRYGAQTVVFSGDLRRGLDLVDLENFLREDHGFKLATFVHCETPSGITNDPHGIGKLLHSYGILSVVDSVSGMGGEPFFFDEAMVDVAIGGTQKCLSALTGLTLITLSDRAIQAMKDRKVPVSSFYGNFQNYLASSDGFDFPYTQSDTLVGALDEALNRTLAMDYVERHARFAERTRNFFVDLGYELYAKDSHSNTVTTVLLKEHQKTSSVLEGMMKRGFIISGTMGEIQDRGIRIGHMGNNIQDESLYEEMLQALKEVLESTEANE